MAAITISSVSITGWQGNANGVQLRIFTTSPFTASNGNIHPQSLTTNPASLGTFFQVYSCSVTGNVLTVPSITLDSTTDSPDNPLAQYAAVLFDSTSGKSIQQFGTSGTFAITPIPTTTSWANVFNPFG